MENPLTTDILILGAGGAGLMAALHAHWRDPSLSVTLVSKGMLGKCGCTRMVQGGYNVALHPKDSVQAHFEDTVKGGAFINDQDLAWALVEDAPRIVLELENRIGCLFDRQPDGRIHQKAFAGQSFDRTVHVGDLTGIEIMSRLRDQVFASRIHCLQNTRGLELLTDLADNLLSARFCSIFKPANLSLPEPKPSFFAPGRGRSCINALPVPRKKPWTAWPWLIVQAQS